ncbi:MAG: 30S ribosome-binding factor RbfA [Chlamydiota bacterium]
MKHLRTERLNSLLREVIFEVISKEVNNPKVAHFTSISSVDVSSDLRHAKVYVSVLGSDEEKKATIAALQSAATFIALKASKKVSIHYFPSLVFKLDTAVEEHLKIEKILQKIHEEDDKRKNG